MDLRAKYDHAIKTCKGRMDGAAEQKGNSLHINGTVKSEADKNLIWDAIKTVSDWRTEIIADIQVVESAVKTYTVQSGDTLGKIAQETLGSASAYMKIFNANTDQLTDPNKIQPGQVLKIPS